MKFGATLPIWCSLKIKFPWEVNVAVRKPRTSNLYPAKRWVNIRVVGLRTIHYLNYKRRNNENKTSFAARLVSRFGGR